MFLQSHLYSKTKKTVGSGFCTHILPWMFQGQGTGGGGSYEACVSTIHIKKMVIQVNEIEWLSFLPTS